LAGASLLAVAAVGLVVLRFDARHVFDGLLSGSGLVFVVLTVLATVGAVWLVRRGNHVGTRLAAIAAVASMVLAWGMAQRPYLLPTTVTVDAGAGDPDSLRWLLIVTIVAVLVVAPALVLLYRLDLTDRLAADHDVDLTEAHSAPETTLTSPRRQDAPDAEPSPHP
jgi:cytochrome d ubiquinol oxidase subunit II